jgi:hypothetical protein
MVDRLSGIRGNPGEQISPPGSQLAVALPTMNAFVFFYVPLSAFVRGYAPEAVWAARPTLLSLCAAFVAFAYRDVTNRMKWQRLHLQVRDEPLSLVSARRAAALRVAVGSTVALLVCIALARI